MQRVFSSLLSRLSLSILSIVIPVAVKAQVTPDGTTSTNVTQEGDNFAIEQGDRVGDNLFHSFEQFSVPTGGSAGFNNADSIANIFSRVTGGDISNIDGLLSANGTANLFLINPNGIIFGENARLDLGGSFYGSTADSLLFDGDVEFSASNPNAAPLLEVSIPIGLSFRDNPGDVINRSFAPDAVNPSNFARLEVLPGNNLTFVGGDIDFESGIAIARGGNIELGGLSQAGTVGINEDGSLSFPEDLAKADISLSNFADLDVQGTGGGNITINARNLSLESGELGRSLIRAGISSESTSAEAQAGDININITGNIALDNSLIVNDVNPRGVGNSGDIKINTSSVDATNGGIVGTFIFGQGNTGDISIVATESVTLNADGTISNLIEVQGNGDAGITNIATNNLNLTDGGRVSSTITGNGDGGNIDIDVEETISINGFGNEGVPSGIFSNVSSQNSVGNAGDIQINTSKLALSNGGVINSVTFGRGEAGLVSISATNEITIDGEAENAFFNSTIASGVGGTGIGNSGGIDITTSDLSIINGGLINTRTGGSGNGGDINLDVQSLSLDDGGVIDASTFANGNSGKVSIKAANIALDNSSFVASEVVSGATGDSNGIEIAATKLNLANGSQIDTNSLGEGNGGQITINASDSISLGTASGIGSLIGETAIGNSGGVEINTANLSLFDGSLIDTSILGEGDAGQITINAAENITVDGLGSSIFNDIAESSSGNSEGIEINAKNLSLTNGGQINSRAFGVGNGGTIDLQLENALTVTGTGDGASNSSEITTETFSEGDAGNIELTATSLTLKDGGVIDSSTSGTGNGGNISLDLVDFITLSNDGGIISNSFGASGLITNRFELGSGGNINISGESLSLENGARISSGVTSIGFATSGNISIDINGSISLNGENQNGTSSSISASTNGSEDGGNIDIQSGFLFLRDGAKIDSNNNLIGFADGGDITIDVDDSVILSGKSQNGTSSSINVNSVGNSSGGNIDIRAQSLFLNGAKLSSSLENGAVSDSAMGTGGNINLKISEILSLDDNALISARAFEEADGGNLSIESGFILAFPDGNNDIVARAERGNGGRISIDTEAIFGLEERLSEPANFTNDIDASSEFGLQGDFSLNTPDFDPTSGLIELPAAVGNASDQISQNPCQQGVGSEFIVTGKGGLPTNPNESLSSSDVEVGLVEPLLGLGEEKTGRGGEAVQTDNQTTEAFDKSQTIPAQGWVFNDRGEVTLVANSNPDRKIERSPATPTSCNSKNSN